MTLSQNANLFPIDHDVLSDALHTFHHLDNDELTILVAANTTLLPEDNPTRFVLDLHVRPDLRRGDSASDELRRHTYRVSVLLGRHIVKHSIEIDDGYDSVKMTDKQKAVITEDTRDSKIYTPKIEQLAGVAPDVSQPEAGELYPYLSPEDEAMQEALMMKWHNDGLSFLRDEAKNQHVSDELLNGMKDLFRTYALLDEDPYKNWHLKRHGLHLLS